MNREETQTAVNAFIGRLAGLARRLDTGNRHQAAEARAVFAQLRRGLGKPAGIATEALPHILPGLPDSATREEVEAFLLVGGLFAEHPVPAAGDQSRRNFGGVMRAIGDHDSAVKRFKALLNCNRAQLDGHLRQAIRLAAGAKRKEPVNYFALLHDVLRWDQPERDVQLKWARDYWRQAPSNSDVTDHDTPAGEETDR